MVEFTIETVAQVGTAAATIALVFLLWRTIRQMEATVTLSRIQTEYRFRPWIGPSGGIKELENSINGKNQFEIKIKNFGELPSSNVRAHFIMSEKKMERKKTYDNNAEYVDLGPILPNMEKRYWFFIDPQVWENVKAGRKRMFTGLYFQYPLTTRNSGYGMISEYNPDSKNFIHRDMWIDDTNSS